MNNCFGIGLAYLLLIKGGVNYMFCNANSENLKLRNMKDESSLSSAGIATDEVMVKSTNSLMLPVSAGQGFHKTFSEIDLFKGYKINALGHESTFKGKVFSGSIAVRPNGQQFNEAGVIQTMEEFNDLMDVSGELSVSYGPLIEGRGSGNYVKENMSSRNKVVVMFVSRRGAYSLLANEVKPLDEVKDFIKTGDPSQIYDKFGTLFVNEIQYGGYLNILYTIESEKTVDSELIKAELVARIGVGPLKGDIKAKFEKQDGQKTAEYKMNIKVVARGIQNLIVPLNPTFDEASNIIDDYNTKYEELVSALGDVKDFEDIRDLPITDQMAPVAFGLAHTEHYINELNPVEASYMMAQMKSLSDVLSRTLFYKAQLSSEEKEMELKAQENPVFRRRVLNKWLVPKKSEDERLQLKLEECLEFRGKKVEDIFANKLRAPKALNHLELEKIHALLGEGFVFPLILNGKTFQGMYYQGYTMYENDVEVPFYYGSVSCDSNDDLISGPDELDKLNIKSNSCGPPSSCLELKERTNEQLDGEYEIGYLSFPPFKVYCKDMNQDYPKEYLDLRGRENYSQYTLGGQYLSGTTHRTTFLKIRLNPRTLEVDNNDLTYTTRVGEITDNKGLVYNALSFGRAYDCVAGHKGIAQIDLTATPFKIADGVELQSQGHLAKCHTLKRTNQVLRFKGGGLCGACVVSKSRYLKLSYKEQLLESEVGAS